MKRTYSTLSRNLIALCVLLITSVSAQAVPLTEYVLPSGSSPLQLDATSSSGSVFFVDQGLLTINRIGGAFLTSWAPPFTPTVPGSIVVDRLAGGNRFVYVTDLPGTTLGQLDLGANVYFLYNLTLLPWGVANGPRQLVYDNSHSVEPNDDVVWFSASGDAASGSVPLIGYFSPATFKFKVWPLPPSVANPGDAIDGLAFNITGSGPTVFFTVNGPTSFGNYSIATLQPLTNLLNAWPLPATYFQAVPIVATRAGEVYRLQGFGFNTMARVNTVTNILDEWMSPVDFTDIFLTLDPVALVPRFTSWSGATTSSDMIISTCPAATSNVPPIVDRSIPDIAFLQPNEVPVPPTFQDTPPQITEVDTTPQCPFLKWQPISSTGPISMDGTGHTWISETAAGLIANF